MISVRTIAIEVKDENFQEKIEKKIKLREKQTSQLITAPYNRIEKLQLYGYTAGTFFSILSTGAAASSLTIIPSALIVTATVIGALIVPASTTRETMKSIKKIRRRNQNCLNRDNARAARRLRDEKLITKSQNLLNNNLTVTTPSLPPIARKQSTNLLLPNDINTPLGASKYYGQMHRNKAVKRRERKEYQQKRKKLEDRLASYQTSQPAAQIKDYSSFYTVKKDPTEKFSQTMEVVGATGFSAYAASALTYGLIAGCYLLKGANAPDLFSDLVIGLAVPTGVIVGIVGGFLAYRENGYEDKEVQSERIDVVETIVEEERWEAFSGEVNDFENEINAEKIAASEDSPENTPTTLSGTAANDITQENLPHMPLQNNSSSSDGTDNSVPKTSTFWGGIFHKSSSNVNATSPKSVDAPNQASNTENMPAPTPQAVVLPKKTKKKVLNNLNNSLDKSKLYSKKNANDNHANNKTIKILRSN